MDQTWLRVGGIAGIATVFGYMTVLFAPLPWAFRRSLFFALGLGGIIFVLGLDRMLKLHSRAVTREIATLFGIIGMAVMNLMAVVQNSIDVLMKQGIPSAKDTTTLQMVDWVRRSVNSVQLGMDISFDIFFLVSVMLFGISMLRHPRFGAKFGIPGCAVGAATLGLNLYSFPLPPEPDLGPLVALWLCIVAVRMLFSADYVHRGQFGLGGKK
jgi:hypothetical protein